ncbi:MAG TPA: ATP-binding cassette domain-containing protein, partial [Ktedonobacterales bacterium]|nr:ATP-binding cassette domain-containing protein [Ktedonobacterales bacterium]
MSTPAMTAADPAAATTLVKIQDLVMHFPITQGIVIQRKIGAVHAVDGVSLSIPRGGTLGLVGESGSGKSTIGRCVVRLYTPTSGHMYLEDQDLASLAGNELRTLRRRVQMVFQDPYASLNPRYTVGSLIAEPMMIHRTASRAEIRARTEDLLQRVGLNPNLVDRYPHEFSGG